MRAPSGSPTAAFLKKFPMFPQASGRTVPSMCPSGELSSYEVEFDSVANCALVSIGEQVSPTRPKQSAPLLANILRRQASYL